MVSWFLPGCSQGGCCLGNAQIDHAGAAGAAVDLGELVLGAGAADFKALDFAEPVLALGLGDAGEQVVADLGGARPLARVRPVHAAPQAAVLVNAGGAECATAYSCCDFPAFEVAEEFLPFLVGRDPVFIGRPLRPPPGQERQVGLDGLFRVDG